MKKENEMAMGKVVTMYDEARLQALELYVREKNGDLNKAMTDTLDRMYARFVPANVQEFLELKRGTEARKKEAARGTDE